MTTSERQKVRVAVYVIFRNSEGKILLIRRHNTGWKDGQYTLPAGHIDSGETALDACVHESLEEVCLKVSPEDLELKNVTQYQPDDISSENYINFFFECSRYEGEAKIGEPEKCDDLIWVLPSEAVDIPIIDSVKFSLEQALNGDVFSHWGFKN